MPDLKISEMPELEPTATGTGVEDSDYLTILDVSELDITQSNKKLRLSTLHEFVAPLDSPQLTGVPRSTTPALADNTTKIATTEWVQNELATITLNTLADISNPGTPEANQILVYNDLTGTFQPQSPTTVNREVLTGTKTLTSACALYQFLDPNNADRDIVLPTGSAGLRFVIKTLDTDYDLNIKETAGGAVQAIIGIASQVAEVVYDGTEWHILSF